MIVFAIVNGYGWAKAETLTECFSHYSHYNGSMKKGQKYGLFIFKAESLDDVDFSNPIEYYTKKATLLSQTTETK